MTPRSLLILGGTAEASALAGATVARFGPALSVTTSFAGRTPSPRPVAGFKRVGGFGGPQGLLRYLCENRVERVIDASHPFAARISSAARLACEEAGVPRLLFLRPPWRRDRRDRWIEVADMAAAAGFLESASGCAFLTVGPSEIAAFAALERMRFVVRLVAPRKEPLPLSRCEIVFGRGPFTLEGERALFTRYGIDLLVSKASGGAASEAKILAARERGMPVVMVARPPREPGPFTQSIEAALDWLLDPEAFGDRGRLG